MIRNWPMIALLLTALAGALTHLSEPPTPIHYLKRFVVIIAVLLALMGFGAVSGKTLGDFLRNVNG